MARRRCAATTAGQPMAAEVLALLLLCHAWHPALAVGGGVETGGGVASAPALTNANSGMLLRSLQPTPAADEVATATAPVITSTASGKVTAALSEAAPVVIDDAPAGVAPPYKVAEAHGLWDPSAVAGIQMPSPLPSTTDAEACHAFSGVKVDDAMGMAVYGAVAVTVGACVAAVFVVVGAVSLAAPMGLLTSLLMGLIVFPRDVGERRVALLCLGDTHFSYVMVAYMAIIFTVARDLLSDPARERRVSKRDSEACSLPFCSSVALVTLAGWEMVEYGVIAATSWATYMRQPTCSSINSPVVAWLPWVLLYTAVASTVCFLAAVVIGVCFNPSKGSLMLFWSIVAVLCEAVQAYATTLLLRSCSARSQYTFYSAALSYSHIFVIAVAWLCWWHHKSLKGYKKLRTASVMTLPPQASAPRLSDGRPRYVHGAAPPAHFVTAAPYV